MYYQKNPNKSKVSLSWYSLGLPRTLYYTVWISFFIVLFLSIFDFFKSSMPIHAWSWHPMKTITSVCFFCSAIAIILLKTRLPVFWSHLIPRLLSIFIGIVSVLNLISEIYFQIQGSILFSATFPVILGFLEPSKRMSLFTAFSFNLISIIIYLMTIRRYNLAHILNIPVSILSYFFLICYLLRIQPATLNLLPVSPNTSVALAALCTMIFMIYPHTGFMRVFVSGSGGLIAQRLILPLILIPLLFGLVRISDEQKEFLNTEIGIVLIVLSYSTCFLFLAWLAARSFTKMDKKRMKSEEASVKLNQKLSLLSEVSGRLLISEDPQRIVNDLCIKIMEYLDCQVFFNYISNDALGRLHLNTYAGISAEEANRISWLDKGSAICGCVALDGSPVIAENIQESEDPRAEIVRRFGVRTYASFPLMSKEKVIGTLSFGAKNRNHFQEDEISLIKTVTDQVAIAMSRIINEKHLRESEDRFRTIAESLPTLISITRISDGTFRFVNDLYCSTLGYTQHELIGKPALDVYMNPSERKEVMKLLQEKGHLDYYETRIKKSDGTPFWIMSSIRPIIFEGEPAYLGSTVNIDHQKKQQDELNRLNSILNALGKSSQMMMHSKNEFEFLDNVCRIITEDCGYVMVWVGYAQNDINKSVEPVAYYGLDKEYIDQMKITWADTERGHGPTGIAIRTGRPSICRNMLTDPDFAPWKDEAIKRGYNSSLVLPLLSEGKTMGVLALYSKETDSFSEDDIRLLSNLADDMAYGIVHFRLLESEKKAALAIKESEEKYRLLFDSMVEGFALKEIIVDGHGQPFDWKFISVNPAFERQTGLKADAIIGKNARQIMPNIEPSWLDYYGKVALKGINADFDNYSSDLNAWFRVSAFQVKKGTFACIVQNITSRILAEKELKNTKDYLESLINYANGPIIVWNPEAEIQLFNRAFEHLTGYTSAEVLGKKIDILFPRETLEDTHRKIRAAITVNWEYIEIPIITKDNRTRIVLWNSANIYDPDDDSILSTIAQGNDITERKLAEEEVRSSKEKLDLALDNASIGIWTWSFLNNQWEWDDRISKMLGIEDSPVSYSLDVLEQYIFEEDMPHVLRAFERSRQSCVPLDTFFRLKHNEGFRYIEVKGSVTLDESGKPVKMSGVCMDITAMKISSEKALFNLNEDLLRSNKELEQFAYVASHDLQEPLRMVSSFTQLLASRYKSKLDNEALEFIDFAVDGAQRMQRLINDLLQYSRVKTRGKSLSATDMNYVYNQTLHNLSIKIAEKKAQIRSDTLPVIKADEGQMLQLLQNLIENGIKFSGKNPVIHVGYEEDKEFHIFSVSDNGIGIEPQYHDRIFQIFQRLHLKDEYGGTGIGLAICQRIVERHGGRIWVDSSNGTGTTFKFTISKL